MNKRRPGEGMRKYEQRVGAAPNSLQRAQPGASAPAPMPAQRPMPAPQPQGMSRGGVASAAMEQMRSRPMYGEDMGRNAPPRFQPAPQGPMPYQGPDRSEGIMPMGPMPDRSGAGLPPKAQPAWDSSWGQPQPLNPAQAGEMTGRFPQLKQPLTPRPGFYPKEGY